MAGAERLFVYGTLLAVAEHPMGTLLRAHAAPLGPGSIQARLYMIDDPDRPGANFYPGAVPSPNPADRVRGEVFEMRDPARLLSAFDRYEACAPGDPEPHEFLLRNVEVRMANGNALRARSYLYTWDVTGARHISSGRFNEAAPEVL